MVYANTPLCVGWLCVIGIGYRSALWSIEIRDHKVGFITSSHHTIHIFCLFFCNLELKQVVRAFIWPSVSHIFDKNWWNWHFYLIFMTRCPYMGISFLPITYCRMVGSQKFKKHISLHRESFHLNTYKPYFWEKMTKLLILGPAVVIWPYMGILLTVNVEKYQKKYEVV